MDIEYTDTNNKKKGRIIDMNEIDKRRKIREKEKFKSEITDDIDDVMSDIFGRIDKKIQGKKNEKDKTITGKIIKLFKFIGLIGLGILVLNFILFNIWLLKYFFNSLTGF